MGYYATIDMYSLEISKEAFYSEKFKKMAYSAANGLSEDHDFKKDENFQHSTIEQILKREFSMVIDTYGNKTADAPITLYCEDLVRWNDSIDEFLEGISEFAEDNSNVDCVGEDNERWRYLYKDKKRINLSCNLCYGDLYACTVSIIDAQMVDGENHPFRDFNGKGFLGVINAESMDEAIKQCCEKYDVPAEMISVEKVL